MLVILLVAWLYTLEPLLLCIHSILKDCYFVVLGGLLYYNFISLHCNSTTFPYVYSVLSVLGYMQVLTAGLGFRLYE